MIELIVATVLISILSIMIYQVKFHRRNYLLSKIPSPKKWFLLHNSPIIVGKSLDVLFKEIASWHDELGSVCHMTLHPFDAGLALVRRILSDRSFNKNLECLRH